MSRMKRCIAMILALGLLLAVGLSAAACGGDEGSEGTEPDGDGAAKTGVVKIGLNVPLSGAAAGWGLPGTEGLKIVCDWYNEAGGVKIGDTTYTFEVVKYDNEAIGSKALLGARKLVLQDEVSLILDLGGPTIASQAPFLTEQKIPAFTLIAQDCKADRPYVFAVTDHCPAYFVIDMQHVATTHPEAKTMALLAQDEEIAECSAAWSEAAADVEGIEVVYNKPFGLDTTDFAPIMTAALKDDPEILNVTACYPEFQALIFEQAYLQGWKGIIVSACWDMKAILAKVPKDFMAGAVSNFPNFDDPGLADKGDFAAGHTYQEFWDQWEQDYPNSSYSEIVWEYVSGFDVWLWGAQQAGSIDGEAVKAALEAGTDIPRSFGPGNWVGMDYFGIDHLLTPNLPVTEIQADGEPLIAGWYMLNDWFTRDGAPEALDGALERYGLQPK